MSLARAACCFNQVYLVAYCDGVLNVKMPLPGAAFKIWPLKCAPEVTYFGADFWPSFKCRSWQWRLCAKIDAVAISGCYFGSLIAAQKMRCSIFQHTIYCQYIDIDMYKNLQDKIFFTSICFLLSHFLTFVHAFYLLLDKRQVLFLDKRRVVDKRRTLFLDKRGERCWIQLLAVLLSNLLNHHLIKKI